MNIQQKTTSDVADIETVVDDNEDPYPPPSQDIGDSRTFEFFIIQSTNFCLNAVLTFFVRKMNGLVDHFTSVLWT